jgi:hypothetical protein
MQSPRLCGIPARPTPAEASSRLSPRSPPPKAKCLPAAGNSDRGGSRRPGGSRRSLVMAIAAGGVEVDAGAGDEGDRPLHRPHDLAKRNLAGRAGEAISTSRASRASHEPCLLEVEHDQLEIFRRDTLRLRDACQLHRSTCRVLGDVEQGTQRVPGFLSQHAQSIACG